MPNALELKDVTAGYGRTVILEDVSLVVQPGAALAVLGRNGVGKTTLMRTIAGQTSLHGGAVFIEGQDVSAAPSWSRARLGLGYVPQEREVFPSLTVLENISVGWRPGPWTLARVFDLFPQLSARQRNYGNQLSGGEQQMLAIARALALQPRILLMDEPFEGLAPNIVEQLVEIFRQLRQAGLTIVLVEQHARLALEMTDTAIVLVRGRIVLAEPSASLLADSRRLDEALTVQDSRPSGDDDAARRG
jgi:branched-chain amino acid transport system ATP-binding protein